MKGQFLLLAAIALGLFSCSEKKYPESQKAVMAMFNPTELHVEEIDEQSGCLIHLTMTNPRKVSADYSREKIISTAALVFWRNLSADASAASCRISATVEQEGKIEERVYPSADLRRTEELIAVVSTFFECDPSAGIDPLKSLVDADFVTDTALLVLTKNLSEYDSIGGKSVEFHIGGFRFEQAQIAGGRALVVWAESIHERLTVPFTFYFSMESGKMLLIASEDMK